jgi:hypothetical protein
MLGGNIVPEVGYASAGGGVEGSFWAPEKRPDALGGTFPVDTTP